MNTEVPSQNNDSIQGTTADATVLAQGAGIALAGRVVGRGLSVVVQAVVARGLGPVAYGLYGLGWTILRMGVSIASLGLGYGVVRYGSHHVREGSARLRDVLVQAIGLAMILSVVGGAILYASADWLAAVVFTKTDLAPVIRLFAVGLVFASGLQVAASATRISKRIQYSAISQELAQPLTNLVLVIIAFLLGWGLLEVVGAAVASFAVALVIAGWFVYRLFGRAFASDERPKLLVRQLLMFSAPAALANMFAGFPLVVDRLIVGHFRPAPEVGIYQAASSASSFFPVILTAFSAILGPMIADMQHLGERERLLEVYRVSTKWAVYVSLPIFLVVIAGARELMATLFGVKYISGAVLLVILATGQFINVTTGSINTVFVMTGHQNRWLLLSGAGLAADLVLGYVLTGRFGTAGAAFATALSVGAVWVLAIFEGRRLLSLWPYDRRFLKGLGAAGAALCGVAVVRVGVNASALVTLVVMSLTSATLFLGVLLALGIDPEDRDVLLYVRRRLGMGGDSSRNDSRV